MGFEFRKKTIELDIAGNYFEIEKNKEFDSKVLEFSAEAFKMADEIKGSKNDAEAVRKCCDLCKETINTLLNDEKASEKIFSGVDADMIDYMDVVSYIFDEVDKYKKSSVERVKNFASKYNKTAQKPHYNNKKKNKR